MISEYAIIDGMARIGANVKIGPFSVIGPNVEIGEGTEIASHALIKGPTKIGKNNKIYQFTSIGDDCQDKKYQGEETWLKIGDNNIFRECCTVHRGTIQGGGITKIGNYNLFMINTHIAHDCIVGNYTVFSNCASIAGHVKVDDYASLGGMVGVHQFCAIGAHSYAGGGTIVTKDVLPFVRISGYPAKIHGLNTVGIERRNFSVEVMEMLRKAYKIIFRQSHTVEECLKLLSPLTEDCSEINLLIDFMQNTTRGLVR